MNRCLFIHSFDKQAVILVSMDGFRADYFERNFSPNIRKLGMFHISYSIILRIVKLVFKGLADGEIHCNAKSKLKKY